MKKFITKHSISLLLSLLLSVFIVSNVDAQDKKKQEGGGKMKREKINAEQATFITQELDFSVEEARAFWPVYDEYHAKKKSAQHSYYEKYGKWREKADSLSKDQQTELADAPIVLEQKLLDLKKEYHAKFKEILPPLKVSKLYKAEREFKMMLYRKMREHRGERGGEGSGKGERGYRGERGQRDRCDDHERGR